ncbi:MAG: hypothetical protein ACJ76N_24045 [Thermoanaerobaculia bacterium]
MARTVDAEFEKNVFINCPFDDGYRPLLRPLLFTILHLGFNPKIALEPVRFRRGPHSQDLWFDSSFEVQHP